MDNNPSSKAEPLGLRKESLRDNMTDIEVYKTSRENITMHILNIYKDNELPKD